jgi:hypothetical protein
MKKYFIKKIDDKLILCSRDIQAGDEIWNDFSKSFVEIGQEYIDTMTTLKAETSFKKIGEVSPDAKWVKEGMEFDEEDLYYQGGFQGTIPDNYKEVNGMIEVKCPYCGTFH